MKHARGQAVIVAGVRRWKGAAGGGLWQMLVTLAPVLILVLIVGGFAGGQGLWHMAQDFFPVWSFHRP